MQRKIKIDPRVYLKSYMSTPGRGAKSVVGAVDEERLFFTSLREPKETMAYPLKEMERSRFEETEENGNITCGKCKEE